MKLLVIKKMGRIKNILNEINNRLNTAKEKISEFEVIATETIQHEAQKINHSF